MQDCADRSIAWGGMNMLGLRRVAACLSLAALSACATSAFRTPPWTAQHSSTTPTTVEQYLRAHVQSYQRMIADLEAGRHILQVPIIPAAVIGATGVALGAGTDLPIVLGGAASGLAAGSNYLRPQERLGYVIQAQGATLCVNRVYLEQVEVARAWRLLEPLAPLAVAASDPQTGSVVEGDAGQQNRAISQNSSDAGGRQRATLEQQSRHRLADANLQLPLVPSEDLTQTPALQPVVAGVGRIAVGATDTIATRLRSRLAAVGEMPNYNAIVTEIRGRYETAEEVTNDTVATLDARRAKRMPASQAPEAAIRLLAEYPARVAECVAMIQ